MRRFLLPSALAALAALMLVGCAPKEDTSRWQETQKETKRDAPAVAPETVRGKELNAFLPASADGIEVLKKVEKTGNVMAELKEGGKVVANLTIADTSANPSAREKYASSTTQIGGFPSTTMGAMISQVLVGDRWQVTVQSKAPTFKAGDREAWIQKVDLAGLKEFKP